MSDSCNQINNNNHHSHNPKVLNGVKKRYSCNECSYSTDRRDLFRRHENIHKDEKPFRCYICNKMFNRADHVKKHFLRIHKGLEYNVKLIKRSNVIDYSSSSSPPTVDSNQNGENCSLSNGSIDNTIDRSTNNCSTNSQKSGESFTDGYQIVFPKFTSLSPPIQSQRSLLTPIIQQQPQPLQSSSPNQRSLLKQPTPPPPKSLLSLLQHQHQQHPPPPPPTFSSSSSSSSSSSLSSPTPTSPSTYNTNSDSDDDTTITTINHNNQIIIVICGKRNSNQKSIINHMLNNNGLKRCGKYPTQSTNRSISSSSSIALSTRKDKRKQNKPKRASIESNEIEIC